MRCPNSILCVNKVCSPAGVSHKKCYLKRSKFKVAMTKNAKILEIVITKKTRYLSKTEILIKLFLYNPLRTPNHPI